jgi:hypothetical protein
MVREVFGRPPQQQREQGDTITKKFNNFLQETTRGAPLRHNGPRSASTPFPAQCATIRTKAPRKGITTQTNNTPMRTPKEIYIHAFNEGLSEGITGGTPPNEEEISKMADKYLSSTPSWLPSNEEIDAVQAMDDEESQHDSIPDFTYGTESSIPNHWDGPDGDFQSIPSY